MTTKRLKNLKSNVPRGNSNVLRITDSKIDVTDIGTVRDQNAEVISGNHIA